MEFALNLAFNSLSFGQLSTSLAREAFTQNHNPSIFPIGGNVDLSAQIISQEFGNWLQTNINSAPKKHQRTDKTVKLWHINGSLESYSNEQILLTFHETSEITEVEKNILKNQKMVFVTSNYSKKVMEEYGLKNIKYLELGFDHDNFKDLKKTYFTDGSIVHGLAGKLEVCRKAHGKILRTWAKKYGNNKKYRLHAAIFNPFLKPEDQMAIINQELQGERYYNITFLPFMKTNAEYCDYLNSIGIMIALSRGEARDLPVFHAVGLGKHCVGLRAHAYLDYLNDENSILIDPCGRVKAQDGIFFHSDNPQSQYNVGSFYEWDESNMIDALELANKKYEANPLNIKGLELQKRTYKDTLNCIFKEI